MKTKILVIVSMLLSTAVTAVAQHKTAYYSRIDTVAWVVARTDTLDYAPVEYQRKKALQLSRKIRDGKSASIAYPKKLHFRNGTIEVDMAWPGKELGFVGLAFRIRDRHHYEVVYFRPESSGTINAVQYMPEKKPEFNWWDYEADKYQAKATLPLHDWFHVKLVVMDDRVKVFINNSDAPVMDYRPLDSGIGEGSVGFWLGNSEAGVFRNLTVTY